MLSTYQSSMTILPTVSDDYYEKPESGSEELLGALQLPLPNVTAKKHDDACRVIVHPTRPDILGNSRHELLANTSSLCAHQADYLNGVSSMIRNKTSITKRLPQRRMTGSESEDEDDFEMSFACDALGPGSAEDVWRPVLLQNHSGRQWPADPTITSDFSRIKQVPPSKEEFMAQQPPERRPDQEHLRRLEAANNDLRDALDESLYHVHYTKKLFPHFVDGLHEIMGRTAERVRLDNEKFKHKGNKGGRSLLHKPKRKVDLGELYKEQAGDLQRSNFEYQKYKQMIDSYTSIQDSWMYAAGGKPKERPAAPIQEIRNKAQVGVM
eukprot:TRINITY_DN8073_c0_g1_i1.p1 TRINITY_DN8073_c0_g1~~TRINITY_DN8073_c0_g1_i1.p1  ORF type:complete len:324 (+),score=27.75 TRINITY_DN8073_c0_g1_i1:81-1052(+)